MISSVNIPIENIVIHSNSKKTLCSKIEPLSRHLNYGNSTEGSYRVSETELDAEIGSDSSHVEEDLLEEDDEEQFSFLSSKMSVFNREHDFGDPTNPKSSRLFSENNNLTPGKYSSPNNFGIAERSKLKFCSV